ncbi:MAG: hypothetical protein E7675_01070 [Ruminococcaceae bacterium]|nr:hypothetical protein [Oscillospiraceae bacterium]
MNNNNELNNTPIIVNDTDVDASAAAESSIGPKGSKIKKLVAILGSVIILIIAFCCYFFIPTSEQLAITNTLNKYDLNLNDLASLMDRYSTKGVEGSISSELPSPVSLSFKSEFTATNDVGFMTFKIKGSGDEEYNLRFYYDNEYLAISGLTDNPDDYVYISSKDFRKNIENSIFHPDSNSRYALSENDYKRLMVTLDPTKDDQQKQKEVKKAQEELSIIIANAYSKVFTDVDYSWSYETFCFAKTVSGDLDADEVGIVHDYIIDEINNNEKLEILFDEVYGSYTRQELLSTVGQFFRPFSKKDVKVSYTIDGAKIKTLHLVSEFTDESNEEYNKTEIKLNFTYPRNNPSFSGKIETTVDEDRPNYYSLIATQRVNFSLKQNKGQNVYDLILKNYKTFVQPDQKDQRVDEDPQYYRFLHNTENGKFFITGGKNEERKDVYIQGYFLLNKNKGTLLASLDEIEIGDTNIESTVFRADLSLPSKTPSKENVTHISLLEMSEKEFKEFFLTIPFEPLDNIVKEITGSTLFSYSTDHMLIYDSAGLVNAINTYSSAYSDYVKAKGKVNGITTPIEEKIYIYNESLDIYIVLRFNSNNNNLYFDAYYDLPSNITRDYHKAYIDENTGDLIVHNFEVLEYSAPTCNSVGLGKYYCNECKQQFSQVFNQLQHEYHSLHVKFMGMDNIERTGMLECCKHCKIANRFTGGYEHLSFSVKQLEDGSYKMLNYISYGRDYLYVPTEVLEHITITELQFHGNHLKSMIVPHGVKVLDSYACGGDIKVLVLPSSIKEIAEDAFGKDVVPKRIYYIGNKEQWDKIEFNSYQEKWKDVEVIFTDKIPTLEEINQ